MIDILGQHRAERKIALALLVILVLVLLGLRGIVSGGGSDDAAPVSVEAQ